MIQFISKQYLYSLISEEDLQNSLPKRHVNALDLAKVVPSVEHSAKYIFSRVHTPKYRIFLGTASCHRT
jgi:hypothetical protein